MPMELLKKIARSPLPMSFDTAGDIENIWMLRASGLVTAEINRIRGEAQVMAVTWQGRKELRRTEAFENADSPALKAWIARLRATAQRVQPADDADP